MFFVPGKDFLFLSGGVNRLIGLVRHQCISLEIADTLAGTFQIVCIDVKLFARRLARPKAVLGGAFMHGVDFLHGPGHQPRIFVLADTGRYLINLFSVACEIAMIKRPQNKPAKLFWMQVIKILVQVRRNG